MKILCIADHIDPLIYSAYVRERFKDIDCIISVGDLPLAYYGFIVSSLNKPLYFIFGNHNLKHYHWFYKSRSNPHKSVNEGEPHGFGSIFFDDKIKIVKLSSPLLIMGLGGSQNYNKGLHQFSELGMIFRILCLLPQLYYNKLRYDRYLDLFVTHSPARYLGDKEDDTHRGFRCFRWFLRRFKPRYMLHGHVHLYDNAEEREHFFCDTKIINVYKHFVLEMN